MAETRVETTEYEVGFRPRRTKGVDGWGAGYATGIAVAGILALFYYTVEVQREQNRQELRLQRLRIELEELRIGARGLIKEEAA
jgi:hypothetical protein